MSLLRAASSITGLTLVSRVLGLVRDAMMLNIVGVNWVSGSFHIAWMVPNMLRRLFGEGALAAAFIPAFTKTRANQGEDRAKRLLGGVTGVLAISLIGLSVLVVIASLVLPPEFWQLDGGEAATTEERGALLWELTRMLFPYVLPVCLLAVYAGALQSLGSFAPGAAAPVVLNVVWIGGLAFAASQGSDLVSTCRIVAWSLLAGGLLQLLLGAVPLARRGLLPRPRLPERGDGTRSVFLAMAPAALALSIVQVNMLFDQLLAEFLVFAGANNHIYIANRLLLFPHALVAIPLATAVFPELARAAEDPAARRDALARAVRYTLFLSVPAAAGMMVVAMPLIEVVFVHGRYTADDAAQSAAATALLVAGLPALGIAQLYARALFALGDTKTPARIAVYLVFVNLGLNLFFVLVCGLGVAGFTLATTCCSFLNMVMLRRALTRRNSVSNTDWPQLVRITGAAAAMVAALYGLGRALPASEARASMIAFHLAIPIAAGIAAFFVACIALRVRELGELRQWWRNRRHSTRSNSM